MHICTHLLRIITHNRATPQPRVAEIDVPYESLAEVVILGQCHHGNGLAGFRLVFVVGIFDVDHLLSIFDGDERPIARACHVSTLARLGHFIVSRLNAGKNSRMNA